MDWEDVLIALMICLLLGGAIFGATYAGDRAGQRDQVTQIECIKAGGNWSDENGECRQ